MPAHDDCVLWRVTGPSGLATTCVIVSGDEGLALTVERGDELLLAELVENLDTAIRRAGVIRDTLLGTGFTPCDEQ